jgi:hypothetical protein
MFRFIFMGYRRVLFLLGLVLLISVQAGYSQIIRGTVLDATNKAPVTFATIYIDGSFVAVYSDQQGQFELNITGYTSMPIIVSALGYYSVTLKDIPAGKNLAIYMKPKVFEIKEVLVTAKGSKRQRAKNLRIFKSQFLGETFNATRCEIVNEDDIAVQNNKNSDTVKAYASKPIIIRNKALGYTVTYFLDRFEYCISDRLLDMKGNILFREGISVRNSQEKQFERRRQNTFKGSRIHFFRALWADRLTEEGFTLNKTVQIVKYGDLQGHIDSIPEFLELKILICDDKLPVRYFVNYKTKALGSAMIVNTQFVIFKQNGFFDGSAMIWEGEMAKQRVADWLPYEYKMEKK